MASVLGHGVAGAAVARAFELGPRGMVVGAVLASAPDLDMLPGLLLQGDASAFHRTWWSHSPAVAIFGGVATYAGYAAWRRVRGVTLDRREGARYAAFAAVALLTHVVADYALVSPAVLLPRPSLEGAEALEVLRWAGIGFVGLAIDFAFYGAISAAALWLHSRTRRRTAREG